MSEKLREEFRQVLKLTESGETGRIEFDIEGKKYIRLFRPKGRAILLGGGHIAKSLCRLLSMVDFNTVVVDDREEYANAERFPEADLVVCGSFENAISKLEIRSTDYIVIITRAHVCDSECIRAVFENGEPYYIGLLGSRRRTGALIEALAGDGIDKEKLAKINTPIGLDIGALTVDEIAVSIAAQMIQFRRRPSGGRTEKNIFAEETFHEDVVKGIVKDVDRRVLILVYETAGSSPVKSGCFMTVGADGQCVGTVGGGLAENLAIKEACALVGTGESRTITLELVEDEASKEGMMCGGTMKLLLMDL